MTINCVSKFIYRSSNIDEKHFEKIVKQPLPFDNTEYELRISGTVHTDQRIMTFVDHYWGFEVTGGIDQYEPLTILDVKGFIPIRRAGYGFRAGIRKDDIITRINDVYTDSMTLNEAQTLIRKSGKALQIFVRGDNQLDDIFEYTVDFWYKPKRRFPPIFIDNKWPERFNWNDRNKPVYRESNCFMVPSHGDEREEIRRAERRDDERARLEREAFVAPESTENTSTQATQVTQATQSGASQLNPTLTQSQQQRDQQQRGPSPTVPTALTESADNRTERSNGQTNGFTNGTTNGFNH